MFSQRKVTYYGGDVVNYNLEGLSIVMGLNHSRGLIKGNIGSWYKLWNQLFAYLIWKENSGWNISEFDRLIRRS